MEYGRLAILEDGMFTGKYHVYFKLNGVTMYMVDQKLNAKTAAGGKLFFTGSGGFNYLDSYTLEEAKQELKIWEKKLKTQKLRL